MITKAQVALLKMNAKVVLRRMRSRHKDSPVWEEFAKAYQETLAELDTPIFAEFYAKMKAADAEMSPKRRKTKKI